jgi:Sulfotransferase family
MHNEDDKRKEWPAFVIGSMRSGSTLLRYILDSHDRLSCPPESRFLVAFQEFLDAPYVAVGLSGLGCTSEHLRSNVRQFIEGFLSLPARRSGKTRWVDKSPNYYRILSFLEKVFAGQVLFVFIIRHPLDCIASLEEAFPNVSKHNVDPEIARIISLWGKGRYGWAKYWIDVYEQVRLFAASNPSRTHLITYEDLVKAPQETSAGAIRFLGEDPALLKLETAFARRAGSSGLQDPKIRKTSGVHTESLDRWKSWTAAEVETIWEMVGGLAAKFGYEAPL